MSYFNELNPLLIFFWYLAMPVSFLFIIQSIFFLIGKNKQIIKIGNEELILPKFKLLTFKNIVNFLIGFSWGGISFFYSFEEKTFVIFWASIIGISFIAIFHLMNKQIKTAKTINSLDKTT